MNIQSEQHECKTVDNNEYLICLNQRLLRYAKQRLLVPPTAEENASWKQMKYEFKQDDEVYINLLVMLYEDPHRGIINSPALRVELKQRLHNYYITISDELKEIAPGFQNTIKTWLGNYKRETVDYIPSQYNQETGDNPQ